MNKIQVTRKILTTYSAVVTLGVLALLYMNLGGWQTYAAGVIYNVCGGNTSNFSICGVGGNDCNGSSCNAESGSSVQVYKCNPSQVRTENGVLACDGGGGGARIDNGSLSQSYSSYFNSSNNCFIIQMDVVGPNGLVDFVAWKGDNFDNQNGCGVTPPVTTPPVSNPPTCPYSPVDTEFFAHTDINQNATSWFNGNNLNVKNVPVYVDINCFAKNGSQLLPNAKIKMTFHDGTVAIYNTAEARDVYLSQPGNYSAVCYTEEHGGLNGLCSNTDQFTLTGTVTTPPVTTPVVTTPVVTTPPPVTTKPVTPTPTVVIPVTDL